MADHSNSEELIAEFQALPQIDKLMEVQRAALTAWTHLNPAGAPPLVLIGFSDDVLVPAALEKPTPAELRRVAAALMNLADEMDTESQQRKTVPGDSNAD